MYDSSHHNVASRPIGAMSARAALASELDPKGRTSRIKTLRSDGPLVLRKCNPKDAEPLTHRRHDVARVALAAGTAGPLGGDNYALDVHVGAGSTLVLQEVAMMLVLPGLSAEASKMTIRITVEEGATFIWWAEPIIAAHRCNHQHDVRIALAAGARMVLREEMLLGRHGERPGDFTNRLRITHDGRALYDQQLTLGPSADGCDSAAVLDDAGAAGTIIAVDPRWGDAPPPPLPFDRNAVLTPLVGSGIVIGAVAPDSLTLRQLLTAGLNTLGSPWAI